MVSSYDYPDFILNATSLRPYACSGSYPTNPNPVFPNLKTGAMDMFDGNSNIKSFTGPAVTKLNNYALERLNGMTAVNIPNVAVIGNGAFSSCTVLKEINFPLCKTIGMNSFYSCYALTKADIGTCETLGMSAFSSCGKLATLILRGDKVCTMNDANSLGYTSWSKNTPLANMTGAIYVPDNLVDSYKTATNWSIFASIIKPLSTYTG